MAAVWQTGMPTSDGSIKGSSSTHLHATNPDTQRPASRLVALLPLTFLFIWGRVHPILPRPHLQVQHARLLELPGQVFHQNEVFLAGRVGRGARGRRLDGGGCGYQVSNKFGRGRYRCLGVTPPTRNHEGGTRTRSERPGSAPLPGQREERVTEGPLDMSILFRAIELHMEDVTVVRGGESSHFLSSAIAFIFSMLTNISSL